MASARKIEMVRLDEVEIGTNRLRPLSRDRVDGLKDTIADPTCPPLLPIEVCRKPGQKTWTLLDGLHRVTAFRESGRDEIEALVHDNSTLTARTVELQRNLFATDLPPFEKAKHIAELYYLERVKRGLDEGDDPRRLGGRPTKALKEAELETCALSAQVSLSGAVGRSIGLEKRQIQKYLTIYRILAPAVAEKLERFRLDLPLAQLMLLAKQLPAKQLEIVDRLLIPLDHPDPAMLARRVKTVAAALPSRPKSAGDKALSAFIGNFARMSLAEKKGALETLARSMPAGFKIVTPDEMEQIAEVRAALATAFRVAVEQIDGEEVDIDALQDVAQDTQTALIVIDTTFGGARG